MFPSSYFPNVFYPGQFYPHVSSNASDSATFLRSDVTNKGDWKPHYGKSGYSLCKDYSFRNPALPDWATVRLTAAATHLWQAHASEDDRALQAVDPRRGRVAACWYAPDRFTIDLNLTDGNPHQVALYAVDWDKQARNQSITIIDPTSGKPLDRQFLTSFDDGVYLVWELQGKVRIRVQSRGPSNAVLSGLFVD